MIDLTDKKFLKKLSKDLNNGKAHVEDDSLFEIYKPFGSKMFIVFDNHNNKTIYRNSNLELCIKEFNKHVSDYKKQK